MTEKLISPLIDFISSETMNISVELTEDLLEYLDSKVKSGLYKSRSEVIRSAIRDMIKQDLENRLRASGLTPAKIKQLRKKVAGELIAKKYKELG
jgi:putative addiction module CopG family antidote